MEKFKIKSLVPWIVGIVIPEYRINRQFTQEGQVALIDADAMREGMYEFGLKKMFDDGLLFFEDKEARIEFGYALPEDLEEEDKDLAATVKPFNSNQMIALLKVKPFNEFKEACDGMTGEQLLLMANIAIENKITDYEKCSYLKERTGHDTIK